MDEFYKVFFDGKPEAVKIPFDIPIPNENVLVHEGGMELHLDDIKIDLTGKVTFIWFPENGVYLDAKTSPSNFSILNSTNNHTGIEIFINGMKFINLDNVNCSMSTGEPFIKVSGYANGPAILMDKTIPVQKVYFALPNVKDFFGETILLRKGANIKSAAGRLKFSTSGFEISIDKIYDFKDYFELLKNKGGYAILYLGELRSTTDAIKFDETKVALECFSVFLSFLNGRRTAPMFRYGVFESQVKWIDYTSHPVDIYKKVNSWVSSYETPEIDDLWQKFYDLWKNDDDRDFLKLAIHWYIEANSNSGHEEGAIVKAQTALELIYNWYIIEKKKLIIGSDAERISAANKIRLLLSQLQLSPEVPEELSTLISILDPKVSDGPEVFVHIRNSIVHSQSKQRSKLMSMNTKVKSDALKLGIWYIELSLLYILGYTGRYHNRTSSLTMCDAIEFVPWSSKQ